ncbi:MAG: DoxX family protein [Dyadobacter sp.]|uniref:DoxX family protein n=1 Tax=Dyadobacter sp. TaxID=1914288 RepID=UPI0032637064
MTIPAKIGLYSMAAIYIVVGILHLVRPDPFRAMMAPWLPVPMLLIYVSGVAEIVLGMLLIPVKTRPISAKLIIAMLIVYFFAFHIPQSIEYYHSGHKYFIVTLVRLPLQFLLIGWAWLYAKPLR